MSIEECDLSMLQEKAIALLVIRKENPQNYSGFKNDLIDLSVRDWVCPNCQTHHDRDINAAKNLRAEGLRILSTNTVGHTEFQACGEDVRLVNTCVKKRMRPSRRRTAACTRTKQQSSVNQESPVTALA